jgi:Flp pilus assembly protein TadG
MSVRELHRDERGSISVWAVLIVAVFTLVVGISVDLVGQIAAKERATDVAAQAARVAGEQADANTLMAGTGTVAVSPQRARQTALACIAGAGMSGTVTIEAGGTQLAITATATYRPIFLTSIGIGHLTVTGTSTARLIRALNGSER